MQCSKMKGMSAAEESYEGYPISMDLSEVKGLFNLVFLFNNLYGFHYRLLG